MGRAAPSHLKAGADDVKIQVPSTPETAVQRRRSKRKSATEVKDAATTPESHTSAATAAQLPSSSTRKSSQEYWNGSGQDANKASADTPQTPDEPKEKRSRRPNVRLPRTEAVTASIPQQVAAVATLPSQNGAHTFEEAPVAVWSSKLMQEALQKLSAADPCKLPAHHLHLM